MNQKIMLISEDVSEKIKLAADEYKIKNPLLVCDSYLLKQPVFEKLTGEFAHFTVFTDFTPNPRYEEVVNGIRCFKGNTCDGIIAIGGGSALDVAKCIKLYYTAPDDVNFLSIQVNGNNLPLFAIPTTAGTGSESTKFAVIYDNGEKQSVNHDTILPDTAILIPKLLTTLPLFQKKCTMLDAICHAVESYWSVNSTVESRKLSAEAIKEILECYKDYLDGKENGFARIIMAANKAGQAINITQTTAAHAMCYKLTTLYGIPHGYAAAICLPQVWKYMQENIDMCCDLRGAAYLNRVLTELGAVFSKSSMIYSPHTFMDFVKSLNLPDIKGTDADIAILAGSVNQTRLKNNPVHLSQDVIVGIYRKILERGD